MVENKLRIHFVQDKTKFILFSSKFKVISATAQNMKHKYIKIKQHLQVTYIGFALDKTLTGAPMALKALQKHKCEIKINLPYNKF